MSKYVFLFRLKNSDDRDACAYIETRLPRFKCGHYFGAVNLHGSCYCGGNLPEYEDIETVLTKEEYEALVEYSRAISELGYGIEKGDERYQKGIELADGIKPVYDKLIDDFEAEDFFGEIVENEMEILKREYNLDDWDIKTIFDNYGLDYKDRSVVSYVWDDIEDYAYEEALELGYVNMHNHTRDDRYFDYDKFADDLLEDERNVELRDGRIAVLSY